MLSEESLRKLIDIYRTHKFDISLIKHKEDIRDIINILLEIPFFAEIKKTKGYITLKSIVHNMDIKIIPKNTIVFLNNEKEHKCYILLHGITKEETTTGKNRSYLGKSCKCITNCIFGVLDSIFYINNILTDGNILRKNFIEKIKNFKIFSNIFTNHYKRLFLNYDEEIFGKNEIVYRENDKINGVYLILDGEFQLYKKGKQITLKDKIKKNNEKINKLKEKSDLFHRILFGDGPHILPNKQKIINDIRNDSQKNNIKTLFYKNENPYSLLKLKKGDMFGDLEIIQKYNERKLSVKASGLKNIVWFFPKEIIEAILFQINNTTFQNISESKFTIIKRQFNKMGIIDDIRKKYSVNNKTNISKIENDESKNNSNVLLNIKKIKIDKNILQKIKTNNAINMNKIKNDNFCFVTQKIRSLESISSYRRKYKNNYISYMNIRKRIINYLDRRKNLNSTGFNYHNFSNDDNSIIEKETPYSLLTEKRIVKKREFIDKNYRSFSTLHKNKIKINYIKNRNSIIFSKNFFNSLNKE